jgi:bla regulator protein BlaR1
MLAWIAYTIIVSALLGVAALAAERAARLRRLSTRWIWAAAIIASLLLPTVISSVSVQLPPVFTPASDNKPLALRDATSPKLAATLIAATAVPDRAAQAVSAWVGGPASQDLLLKRAWMALSAAMLLALAASAVALLLRKRRWPQQMVAGASVYVAPDAGPAVVGLLRPRIVLPAWLASAPPQQQALVVAHEQAHVTARDPQLLTVAMCLLVLMPWNLPLWWQLRRLRHAIEVDCDARVLRAGHDLQHYGAALIDVGQRQSGFIGAVAAMAESRSFLEQRIRIMVQSPARRSGSIALMLAGCAMCLLAVAAQVAPPNAGPSFAAAQEIDPLNRVQVPVKASRLVHYVGSYQLDEITLIEVIPEGRRLWMQMSRHKKLELYPEADDKFFSRDIDLQVTFRRDARGRVDGLTLHQHGMALQAALLDDAAGAALAAGIARLAAHTTPPPGGEALLRRNIELTMAGTPDLSLLTPVLAKRLAPMRDQAMADLRRLGKVTAVRFVGVGPNGYDVYRVQHEFSERDWYVLLTGTGKVADVYTREVF